MLNQKKVLARHVLSTWSLSEAQSTRRTRKPVFADSSSSRSHSSANSVLSATVCVCVSLSLHAVSPRSVAPSLAAHTHTTRADVRGCRAGSALHRPGRLGGSSDGLLPLLGELLPKLVGLL